MTILDWSIVIAIFGFVLYQGLRSRFYNKSVADFLVANRCAGRYLLGVSEGEAAFGAITLIAMAELEMQAGFTGRPWGAIGMPIFMILAMTGFVSYRFRATRAMTLCEFFEIRYSRKFRIFAGMLAWFSGVLNFGIFPAVGARFFIVWFGFENHIIHLGAVPINLTLAAVMIALITIALLFTYIGGQIAVIITDFWQGVFAGLFFLTILILILIQIDWSVISEAMIAASSPGKSMIDPFDIGDKKDFNMGYFLILYFWAIYTRGSFQGAGGYQAAALTPHESKMGKLLGQYRSQMIYLSILVFAVLGIVYLNHPGYADKAVAVKQTLSHMFSGDVSLEKQMTVPLVLKDFLPIGLIGGFGAAMLGFFISTNNTYMHSWGSIFVQDVLMPLRKKPFSKKGHMLALKMSIGFVAVFAFMFSLLFPIGEYVKLFQQITGAIFLGGCGSVLIGGLYWSRGSTLGAWLALIVGAVGSFGSIILRRIWSAIPFLVEKFGNEMPINSQVMSFYVALSAIAVYVVASLLQRKKPINMDKLLHRGKYAIESEQQELAEHVKKEKPVSRWWKMIGVNSHEFSKTDKGIFLFSFCWTVFLVILWTGSLVAGVWGLMNIQRWLNVYAIGLSSELLVSVIFMVWVTLGGLFDLKKMYRKLAGLKRDETDDGRVEEDEHLAQENERKDIL